MSDPVYGAREKMQEVISSGAGEEERGVRSGATCVHRSRKTKHLCNDRRAAGREPRDGKCLFP